MIKTKSSVEADTFSCLVYSFAILENPLNNQNDTLSLSDALQLWIRVTEVDPEKKAFSFASMDVMSMHHALKEALELDDTEVTGLLLFEYLATIYFQERKFSVETLLERADFVQEYLEKSRMLLNFLRADRLNEIAEGFMSRVSQAVSQYEADHDEETRLILDSRHRLALLRRDAMRTMKHLRVDQFLDGSPEPEIYRPVYGRFLYRWDSANSMIDHMTRMPSGITVNMICHPDPYQTYFAFAIRNGGRFFVFTDKEKTPHPLAAEMTRRPDKILASRSERNWFPYELMGLSFDDEGRAFVAQSNSTVLMPIQQAVQPIKPISELKPSSKIWIAMMLDLIVERFWKEGYQAPALSYTGEMIKCLPAFVEGAKSIGLPAIRHEPLRLDPLTVDEVAQSKGNWKSGHGKNDWMARRYHHEVVEEAMNLVSLPNHKLLLLDKSDSGIKDRIVVGTSSTMGDDGRAVEMRALDASSFGTREELHQDRLFCARFNYAQQIGRLAQLEFEARRDEVKSWVRERVLENQTCLLSMATARHVYLQTPYGSRGTFDDVGITWHGDYKGVFSKRFMARYDLGTELKRDYIYAYLGEEKLIFRGGGQGFPWKNGFPTCCLTDGPANSMIEFVPETPEDLAFLCGCEVTELPDVLQHWTLYEKYVGNSILSRIDPLEWACKNPWRRLSFKVIFFLSKRSMNSIMKSCSFPKSARVSGFDLIPEYTHASNPDA